MSKVKAVIFDCFGVLTIDTWRKFQDEQTDELRPKLKELTRAFDSGYLSRDELSGEVARLTGKSQEEVIEASKPKSVKNTELFAYILDLRSRGYKIGILSNVSNSWITDEFLTDEEKGLFDEVVGSYQIGAVKPDPKTYESISEKLGVDSKECVFIDDQEAYCWGAEQVGMKAIVYKNFIDFKEKLEKIIQQS